MYIWAILVSTRTHCKVLKIIMGNPNYYKLFLDFIDTYLPIGFQGINHNDPLMKKLNIALINNKQHFHVGDMYHLEMLHVDNTIEQGLGIKPAEYNPGVELELTHPEDRDRFIAARTKLLKKSAEMFDKGDDYLLLSSNLRFRHTKGHYKHFLMQAYLFSVMEPLPAVYVFAIKTDIEWFGKIKYGYHFYSGKDMDNFRLPDKELILTGCVFTDREFEILSLIRDGLDSQTIGENLFISSHTVDTHRRNILKKTGKASTAELIMDLQEQGFF